MNAELLLNVDDDLAGRYAISRVLRHAGYEVLEASSVGQALTIIRERHPALVLLDVNLPDGSGFEASARIKADAQTADILILQHSASFVRPSDRARGLDRGADSYLTVPIEPEVLLATVRSLLRLRRAERTVRDLLERERLARTRAEEAVRAKDEFLAVLSHELRTPLNAVLGWARMLALDTIDAGRIKHAAATIERNARAQAQLIEDLLDVSRAVSGHLPLTPAPADLLPIVSSAMETVQMAANAKGVSLELSAPAEPIRVLADSTRMRQVVWNLVSNAIKFTPGGGCVHVTVARQGDTAEVIVHDTGMGIQADALPYVFDRFWQAHPPGGRPGGLGLGLSIVRHLVESHGGSVDVCSEGEGKGATFVVHLPVLREPAS
jgi:signal transduction histidine kinase